MTLFTSAIVFNYAGIVRVFLIALFPCFCEYSSKSIPMRLTKPFSYSSGITVLIFEALGNCARARPSCGRPSPRGRTPTQFRLRQESLVKGNAFGLKPFVEPSRKEVTCPVKSGQQPEASLACWEAISSMKRRQQVQKLCD